MALVTYKFPVSGTTPPTAAQMNVPGGTNTFLIAQVGFLDADTSVAITHNMGLTAAEQANIFPHLSWYWQALASSGETTAPVVTFAAGPAVANQITVTKNFGSAGAGTNGTLIVELLRPHTLIQ